jgi:hypothetical protein
MTLLLPRAENPDAYYTQTNNVVEQILAKTGADDKLETCGPTSAVILLDALGMLGGVRCPGGWEPQPEDMLALWFNDPRNYGIMRTFRDNLDPASIMGNRVPQWYEPAINSVFSVRARFYWGCTVDQIYTALRNGRGVLACMKKPGHYVAIVGFDTDTSEAIYHDPWPDNGWPARYVGTNGRARRLNVEEMQNLQAYRVEVGA